MDSVKYIYQKSSFQGLRFQDTSWKALRSVLRRLEASSAPISEAFWDCFGHFDGGSGQQNSFRTRLGRYGSMFLPWDGLQGGFWIVFEPTFGRSEMFFYLVRSRLLRVL